MMSWPDLINRHIDTTKHATPIRSARIYGGTGWASCVGTDSSGPSTMPRSRRYESLLSCSLFLAFQSKEGSGNVSTCCSGVRFVRELTLLWATGGPHPSAQSDQ